MSQPDRTAAIGRRRLTIYPDRRTRGVQASCRNLRTSTPCAAGTRRLSTGAPSSRGLDGRRSPRRSSSNAAPAPRRSFQPPAALAAKGTITYCATIDNPPRAFYDNQQRPTGFEVELGTEIAVAHGPQGQLGAAPLRRARPGAPGAAVRRADAGAVHPARAPRDHRHDPLLAHRPAHRDRPRRSALSGERRWRTSRAARWPCRTARRSTPSSTRPTPG
jgi:hypothetical protein